MPPNIPAQVTISNNSFSSSSNYKYRLLKNTWVNECTHSSYKNRLKTEGEPVKRISCLLEFWSVLASLMVSFERQGAAETFK